jgi:hypothetical protein
MCFGGCKFVEHVAGTSPGGGLSNVWRPLSRPGVRFVAPRTMARFGRGWPAQGSNNYIGHPHSSTINRAGRS